MIDEPLVYFGKAARSWAVRANPWTNVYGVSRTILALATAATLTFTSPTVLFHSADAHFQCAGPSRISLFCLLATHTELARWLAVMILGLVASGWRPQVTGLLHWWVSFSVETSCFAIDGGDQVTAVLTLLLLPVALTDKRTWHWQSRTNRICQDSEILWRLLALSALVMVRLQVAGIYFHASVAKVGVEDWANGTALYYWLTSPEFGAPPWRLSLLMPLLTHGPTVALMTWGAIVLELFLFAALVMPKRAWSYFLVLGIAFHAAIAFTLGLVSFSLAMTAALILYLRPVGKPFSMPVIYRNAYQRVQQHLSNGQTAAKESIPSHL